MSAYGTSTAIVSLGVSCQTAWQINKQIGLLSELVGEPLRATSSPFDWLIIPPLSFCSWIRAEGRFPDSSDEIVVHPNFYWPRHNLHFWHEFTQRDIVSLQETFEATRQKFEYLFARLISLQSFKRCVFFISNTQSNLDVVRSVSSPMDFRFSREAMSSVVTSVREKFGPSGEVHFVTRHDGSDVDPDPAFNIHQLSCDVAEVFGDDGAWAEVFRAALSPSGVVQPFAA